MRDVCSYKCPPLYIARNSLIQLSELEQRTVKTLAQGLTRQRKTRTRVLLVESHCALRSNFWVSVTVHRIICTICLSMESRIQDETRCTLSLSVIFASRAYVTLTLVGRIMHRRRHIAIIVYSNIIIIVTSFAPISSKIKLSGA